MSNTSFKKSHDSPIPKITLLNIIETSNKLSKVLNNFDKVSPSHTFSPIFLRNRTISPKRTLKKTRLSRHNHNISYIPPPSTKDIDIYLSKVLEEFQIKNPNFDDLKFCYKKPRKTNAFDKYFGENGKEEEKKLVQYVNLCSVQYS